MGTLVNPKRTVAELKELRRRGGRRKRAHGIHSHLKRQRDAARGSSYCGAKTAMIWRLVNPIGFCRVNVNPIVQFMQSFCRAAFLVCGPMIFSVSWCFAATNSSSRLEIVGDKLYIAGIGNGFHVLDISNPAKPKWMGGWKNHTCPVGVQVVDGLAYLANRTSGFEVVDVNNPVAPTPIGHLSTGGDLQTVQVAGRYAYIADLRRGIDVIDISNPRQPRLAGNFANEAQGWSVVADGDHAYASLNGGFLRVFALENGTNAKPVKVVPGTGSFGMQIMNGKLLTKHFGALCLVDIHDPASPTVVADSQIRLAVYSDACARDSLAFVTGGSMGLGICELGAGKIRLLGSVETGYQGWGVRVRGNFAYVVDGGANLHVFDISNPTKPVEVSRLSTENFCSPALSLAGDAAEKSVTATPGSATAITNAPPQLAAGAREANGSFSFSLQGVPGGVYDIQASTDLVHWTVISSSTLPKTGVLTISDPDARLFSNRFYRAIKQP